MSPEKVPRELALPPGASAGTIPTERFPRSRRAGSVFGVPNPTPFDLRFRLFGVPVSVHPAFWVIAIVLGWNMAQQPGIHGPQLWVPGLLAWIVCMFVSILLHEYGHVFAGMVFGSRAHIVLYMMGGLAVGSSEVSRRWQRIVVFLAGPGIQLLLYALLRGLVRVLVARRTVLPEVAEAALDYLLIINLYWALFNLLPIWAMDGGRVTREVCQGLSPGNGVRISLVLSIVTAAVLAMNTLALAYAPDYSLARIHPLLRWFSLGPPVNALLVAALGAFSFFELQQLGQGPTKRWQRREEEEHERLPWERDPDYWKSGSKDPWDD
jgi:stage IV sporulation protein FB